MVIEYYTKQYRCDTNVKTLLLFKKNKYCVILK